MFSLFFCCCVYFCCIHCMQTAKASKLEEEIEPFEAPPGWSLEKRQKEEEIMHDLFLCHSGADKRFVERVALVLEALGVRVFYDQKSIHTGESNEAEIIKRGLF